ncbi:lysozyme inhibitor LprI family protein [Clostridium taeniosporum]|uniref:DUF1311 domain-containing protein n=1 Tax=Clostridium taeniosporum TaxID=394958 RepID=A0A1D7XNX9_9CLOT|nr:lysozyme inhibitor LprI family protein [Clostridium taeniosporum]AOR25041.1 DUF1311 domain-containing protein [Clostridium taeniosporum]
MKRKAILCLVLIGLTSFNFMGCTSSNKDITPKSEQQENTSTESNKTDENNKTKTDSNLDNKTTETDKAKNNTDNKNSQNSTKEVNNKKTEKSVKENNDTQKIKQSTKQIYKNKLDNIELGMKDLNKMESTGINGEMISAAGKKHIRWDNALNEIYGVLKKQLSADDMKKLENEEIKWISDRDDKAKKDSSHYKGGRLYEYIYRLSLAQTTKERCYELVEKYMK